MLKLNLKKINFAKLNGLIPAIVQNNVTGQVLMLGFMNAAALQKTLRSRRVWFYSRSKKRLWQKGERSGNGLKVVSLALDCDNDSVLILVTPLGPTCHTNTVSCFFGGDFPSSLLFLQSLYQTILERQKNPPADSYTAGLFKAGLKKILKKINEESTEVIIAATGETKIRLVEESADLLFHLWVLLAKKNITPGEVINELIKRSK